jgi:hypothetical protein
MTPRFPDIRVSLEGNDGAVILYRCEVAARHHMTSKKLGQFLSYAKKGNYNHLIKTCMEWFTCE